MPGTNLATKSSSSSDTKLPTLGASSSTRNLIFLHLVPAFVV